MAMALTSRATVYDRYAISRKFTAQETSINVVQGNISLLASESEITELKNGNKTMYSKLATVEVDLKSITLAVSSSEYQDINGVLSAITQARASITLNTQQIELKVSKDSIVSTINQSAEAISINANKISLEGLTTINGNFKILTDGSLETKNGKFAGTLISDSSTSAIEINNGAQMYYAVVSGAKAWSCTIKSGDNPDHPMDTALEFSKNGTFYFRSRKDDAITFHENYISVVPGATTDTGVIRMHQEVKLFGNLSGINVVKIVSQLQVTETAIMYKSVDCRDNLTVYKNLSVQGTKNRIVKTKSFGVVAQSAYETAEPMFGDMGHGVINEFGECIVFIDSKFSETVSTEYGYYVFLTKYSSGDAWVSEKGLTTFKISGEPGVEFDWEIKAHQKGYETDRLEMVDVAV